MRMAYGVSITRTISSSTRRQILEQPTAMTEQHRHLANLNSSGTGLERPLRAVYAPCTITLRSRAAVFACAIELAMGNPRAGEAPTPGWAGLSGRLPWTS
jgi:hypothetical protein